MKTFSSDDEGRITFDGAPYLYSTCGTTEAGLARAADKAKWLNECLAAALAEVQADLESERSWAQTYFEQAQAAQ